MRCELEWYFLAVNPFNLHYEWYYNCMPCRFMEPGHQLWCDPIRFVSVHEIYELGQFLHVAVSRERYVYKCCSQKSAYMRYKNVQHVFKSSHVFCLGWRIPNRRRSHTYTHIIVIFQDCFMVRSILRSKHLHTILCSKLDNHLFFFRFQCSSHQI